VKFEVVMVTDMKMAIFWDVAPCIVVDIGVRFRGAYCLHHDPDDGGSKPI
jgi:hypothetical protein